MCIPTYVHTYIHMNMHICIYIYIYTCACVHTHHKHVQLHTFAHVPTHMHNKHVHNAIFFVVLANSRMYSCIFFREYKYKFILKHTHTHTFTRAHTHAQVLEAQYTRFGVEVTFVDTSNTSSVREAIRNNTVLIYLESPSNPTVYICI